jgi:hypothetical protein
MCCEAAGKEETSQDWYADLKNQPTAVDTDQHRQVIALLLLYRKPAR